MHFERTRVGLVPLCFPKIEPGDDISIQDRCMHRCTDESEFSAVFCSLGTAKASERWDWDGRGKELRLLMGT